MHRTRVSNSKAYRATEILAPEAHKWIYFNFWTEKVQRKHLVPHLTQVLDLLYGFHAIFLHTSSDRELILLGTMFLASLEAPPAGPEAPPTACWRHTPLLPRN